MKTLVALYIILAASLLTASAQQMSSPLSLHDRILSGDTTVVGNPPPSSIRHPLSPSPNDSHWDSRFGMPGVDGEVYTLAIDARNVYVGGRFTAIGDIIANNIARWDGQQWQRLAGGLNNYIYSMRFDGGKLYVGGTFTTAGVAAAEHIAVWDGAVWKGFGEGLNGSVRTVVVHKGEVYAGGDFNMSGSDTMNLVAHWDAASGKWRAVGQPTALSYPSRVNALASSGDMLAVGGEFTGTIGVATVSNMVLWDGTQWRYMMSGMPQGTYPSFVYTLLALPDTIYAGGAFQRAGLGYAENVAALIPSQQHWTTLNHGLNNVVTGLASLGHDIYGIGPFTSMDGSLALRTMHWDGVRGSSMGSGIGGELHTDSMREDERYFNWFHLSTLAADGKNVYVGGLFPRAGNIVAPGRWSMDTIWEYNLPGGTIKWSGLRWYSNTINLASWSDGAWDTVTAMNATDVIYALATYRGEIYATFDNYNLLGVYRWDGHQWVRIGNTFSVLHTSPNVLAVDSNGVLYAVGGSTTSAGIFRWNASTTMWESLGGNVNGAINTIAVDGERIYVGGTFTMAGNVAASCIAVYNTSTSTWSSLAGGVDRDDPVNPVEDLKNPPYVKTITAQQGRVYVGGWFNIAGDTTTPNSVAANNVAMWDGERWDALGSGVDSVVNSIVVSGEDVYLGGAFRNVGGVIPSWFFAHWNATTSSVRQEHVKPDQTLNIAAVPNPSSDRTQLRFTTTSSGMVHLSIYDLMGREVASVLDAKMNAGEHSMEFDASTLAAGMYYCRIISGTAAAMTSLVIVH